ncbi:MAG: hypothetical protein GC184_14435 [Rhizobiales bacterium]|nr:hypothetical protein [Hyphomicrobiales bacterium]
MNRIGTKGDPRYRHVAEDRILDYLLLLGFPQLVRTGERAQAMRAARNALSRWVEMGLPRSTDSRGVNHYAPFEVVNFMKWAGRYQGDPFWAVQYIQTARRHALAQDAAWAALGPPFKAGLLPDKKIQLTFTRSFNLSTLEPGKPVRLRLPVPLEDEKLVLSSFEIGQTADDEIKLRKSADRLEARLNVPASRQVSLSYQAVFDIPMNDVDAIMKGPPAALDDHERRLYTEPSEGFIRVSPAVLALADDLTGPGDTPRESAVSFWNDLMDRLMFGLIHYHEIDMAQPMDWLLDHVWSDCQLGSALFVSLCRAKKIPARIRGGIKLYPDACDPHYWAEVWFDDSGWTPFDFGAWDLAIGGQDRDWREIYLGAVDYRMTTECLPRFFVGPMSLRLPEAWNLVTRLEDEGISATYGNALTGAETYRDHIVMSEMH